MNSKTNYNTGFASGGVPPTSRGGQCKFGALCFYSGLVQVDPEVSGCFETRPNAKPVTLKNPNLYPLNPNQNQTQWKV